ncbi:hypothetical protein RJZ90_005095 [Blastomyces dermatitidis]
MFHAKQTCHTHQSQKQVVAILHAQGIEFFRPPWLTLARSFVEFCFPAEQTKHVVEGQFLDLRLAVNLCQERDKNSYNIIHKMGFPPSARIFIVAFLVILVTRLM